ncbi:hypothetical protein DPMN_023981 [Dreissena polymorpha]|uniref:Uncharacterized protein n=1 Tax=Dreissena polymorpha TaxID=45954 RepID=A0A9D4LM55_DREPO|nr:hypothetical protein DPMN_023981 [Dreissena polymorpha]
MLMDILPFIGRLSKTFQTNVIDFSKIRPAVSATCDSLEDLLEAEGVYPDKLSEFVTNEDGKSEYKRPVSESKAAVVKENVSENIDGFSGFEQVRDDYDDEDDIIPESSAQLKGESDIIHCVSLKYADVQKNVLQIVNEEYIKEVAQNLRNRFNDLDTLEMLSALDPNEIKKN